MVRQSAAQHRIFRDRSALGGLLGLLGGGGIDDDHKPFERRGVLIIYENLAPNNT